ncbi:hypothetical protein [Streptomyces sp. NPDC002851]
MRLRAEQITSTAFADNTASRRVSEKFGYVPNGVRRLAVGNRLVEAHDALITADQWRGQTQPTTRVEGFDECRHMFGVHPEPTELEPVDVLLHL